MPFLIPHLEQTEMLWEGEDPIMSTQLEDQSVTFRISSYKGKIESKDLDSLESSNYFLCFIKLRFYGTHEGWDKIMGAKN